MPDHLDENGYVIAEPEHPHLDPHAIIDCPLCDDDGYRGTTVCDHQDHTPTTERGMAKVRQAMGWNQ